MKTINSSAARPPPPIATACDMLEGVAFDNKPIDRIKAEQLTIEAEVLTASVR